MIEFVLGAVMGFMAGLIPMVLVLEYLSRKEDEDE